MSNRALYGSQATLSIPLAGMYGFQLDSFAGGYDGRFVGALGGHLFWRNPVQGMLGLYGAATYWDSFGGVTAGHIAGEGEAYWGRYTLQGIAGVEFGSSFVRTRFFDKINVNYYFTDDFKGFVGHRYIGGKNALALGAEYGFRSGGAVMPSLFVEARIGERNFNGVWGGLKFYFGHKDKSLIARNREDDPINWTPETIFSIINDDPGPPPPPSPPSSNEIPL
jgi:hypothetical protein